MQQVNDSTCVEKMHFFLCNNDNDSQSNGKGCVFESYWMSLKLYLEINGEKDTH